MAIKVPVGKTSFRKIRKDGFYYIDKTRMISDLLDNGNMVTLLTRPRRFGKTLMLSTIEDFLAIQNNKDETRKLFEGLDIMERTDLVERRMGQHPVMRFSFNGVTGASFEQLMESILAKMQDWCSLNARLFDFDKCAKADVELYNRVMEGEACEKYDDSKKGKRLRKADMERFLVTMVRMLYATNEKEVVVLLDEYDVPLAKASVLKDKVNVKDDIYISAYDAMKNFIADLFGPALKDNNTHLEMAIVTGCMHITHASIFTGINNFAWYGIQRAGYDDAFGFTPEEVEKLLGDAGMPERMKDFKEWYDGYLFGRSKVYCPWDVLRQVGILQGKSKHAMKGHWIGTSGNEILRQMLRNPKMNIEKECAALLAGGSIIAKIDDNMTYDILSGNKNNLWMVLYQTGYLTLKSFDDGGDTVRLVIPNKEVRKAFEEKIIDWMVERSDTSHAVDIVNALLAHKPEEAASLLSKHLLESMSYFNYKEDFYHGFIGAYLKIESYQLVTDREFGLGRPDIVLYDATETDAIVIEVKYSKDEQGYLGKLKEAVNQCITDQYIQGAKTQFENVVCYGLACYEKKCVLQEVTENDTVDKPRQRKRRVSKTAKKS